MHYTEARKIVNTINDRIQSQARKIKSDKKFKFDVNSILLFANGGIHRKFIYQVKNKKFYVAINRKTGRVRLYRYFNRKINWYMDSKSLPCRRKLNVNQMIHAIVCGYAENYFDE